MNDEGELWPCPLRTRHPPQVPSIAFIRVTIVAVAVGMQLRVEYGEPMPKRKMEPRPRNSGMKDTQWMKSQKITNTYHITTK